MNTHLTTGDSSTLLRRALVANALFSGVSGVILALGARPVAAFLGLDNALYLIVTGVLLLLYAADLLYVATRPTVNRTAAWLAVALDLLWVAGSAAILRPSSVMRSPASSACNWSSSSIAWRKCPAGGGSSHCSWPGSLTPQFFSSRASPARSADMISASVWVLSPA